MSTNNFKYKENPLSKGNTEAPGTSFSHFIDDDDGKISFQNREPIQDFRPKPYEPEDPNKLTAEEEVHKKFSPGELADQFKFKNVMKSEYAYFCPDCNAKLGWLHTSVGEHQKTCLMTKKRKEREAEALAASRALNNTFAEIESLEKTHAMIADRMPKLWDKLQWFCRTYGKNSEFADDSIDRRVEEFLDKDSTTTKPRAVAKVGRRS